ncbi:MAG: hypothetical protein HY044_00540 [Candidatus Woesebacteria bacterium]|nr:MAG: hypothetical protein HY044_00540 [Candidatus Woesebacteria bacterium]
MPEWFWLMPKETQIVILCVSILIALALFVVVFGIFWLLNRGGSAYEFSPVQTESESLEEEREYHRELGRDPARK